MSTTSELPVSDVLNGHESAVRLEGSLRRPIKDLRFHDLFCLTAGLGGLQVVWATIMSEGSPFLLSLGLPPALVSLVWLAGPICGTVFQPYIGYQSDHCTHEWGRRKPFIIYGTIATVIFLNLLPWTSEMVNFSCHLLRIENKVAAVTTLKLILAVVWVWALNIAIQPIQAGLRALIIDSCPARQQVQASSFTGCVVIIGSAVGYGCGFLKFPTGPEWIENTQFKGLCFIASVSLGCSITITTITVRESNRSQIPRGFRYGHIYREIFRSIYSLPPSIGRVCTVQFFSWLTWFPFLFSISTYLSHLYKYQALWKKMGRPSFRYYTALQDQSIRHAILAMVMFSLVALFASLTLPNVISERHPSRMLDQRWTTEQIRGRKWISLPQLWMYSHILLSLCLLGVTLTDNFICAVLFTATLGISWALTQWAPFAIIASEISQEQEVKSEDLGDAISVEPFSAPMASFSTLARKDHETDIDKIESQSPSSGIVEVDISSRAATIMGVHNVFIALPQVLSAVVGSIIYAGSDFFQLGDGSAIVWVLRVGSFSGLAAAYFCCGFKGWR